MPSHEAVPGLRRGTFCSCRKYPKTRLGGAAPDEAPAKGRPGLIGPSPPKDPHFTGAQDRVAASSFRRWGKPIHSAPDFRCRSSGSCRTPPGPRDTPSADGPSWPGALPWAAEGAAFVSMNGNGAGGREHPDFTRRSMNGRHRRARKRFSLAVRHRFFWRCQKKWGREKASQRRQPLDQGPGAPAPGFWSLAPGYGTGRRP